MVILYMLAAVAVVVACGAAFYFYGKAGRAVAACMQVDQTLELTEAALRTTQAEREALLVERAVLLEKVDHAQQLLTLSQAQAEQAAARLERELTDERTRLKELFDAERREQAEKYSHLFENLSNEILDRKSQSLREQSQEGIKAMLKPFAENIERFRERIEAESKQRFALEKEVARMAELNQRMTQEANNLTSALKGNSKTQGDWGEMILETMLESSGLRRDIHFSVQQSVRTEDGAQLRPDVILNLPEEKQVVIDSKVSLRAYVAMTEAEIPELAKRMQAMHVTAIREHINELGAKKYHELVTSPDFVIMFVPNEPAFLLALQADNSLWSYAYGKGVILSSPTNLFAILRIVDELWKRDSQSKNALEIARQGGELYDKFVGFVEVFTSIGASLEKGTQQYQRALGQLSQGKGNLARRAENLRELGLKTAKQIPQSLLDQ